MFYSRSCDCSIEMMGYHVLYAMLEFLCETVPTHYCSHMSDCCVQCTIRARNLKPLYTLYSLAFNFFSVSTCGMLSYTQPSSDPRNCSNGNVLLEIIPLRSLLFFR